MLKPKELKALMSTLEQNQLLLREIGLRYGVPAGNLSVQASLDGGRLISSPEDVYARCGAEMSDYPQEHLRVLLLNTKNVVLDEVTVYVGNVNSSIVRPAEVFRPAVIANAPSVIVCHNHPSGDPTPSPEDVAITRDLVAAGKLLGIEVLDHVVIGLEGRYVSMKERQLGF